MPRAHPLYEPIAPDILCCIADVSTNQTAETILHEDLLYASGENLTSEEHADGISISFNHKLSLLRVRLTKGTEFDDAVEVNSVTVASCYEQVALDVTSGQLYTALYSNSTKTISMYGTKANAETSVFKDTWEALLIPKTFAASEFQVTITVDDDGRQRSFVYTMPNEFNLEEGTANTINLIIGQDKVVASGISARAWVEGGDDTFETD